jgi:anti-sigma factor ChrR (cupin superfamily)
MQARAQVNADPDKVVMLDTNKMDWEPTEHPGVSRKVLERIVDPKKGRETSLLKFAPGASLPAEVLTTRMDVFVLDGVYSDGHGEYGQHTFIRNPAGSQHTSSSKAGCVVYVKWRVPIRPKQPDERMVIDAKTTPWTPFPHRGADVLHLYRDMHGIETSRFGFVHPHKKIPSHDHAIGEETLIIKGCLKDEYTAYTPGIWFRMPIGVAHAPYTEDDGCMMLVRDGDLVW